MQAGLNAFDYYIYIAKCATGEIPCVTPVPAYFIYVSVRSHMDKCFLCSRDGIKSHGGGRLPVTVICCGGD